MFAPRYPATPGHKHVAAGGDKAVALLPAATGRDTNAGTGAESGALKQRAAAGVGGGRSGAFTGADAFGVLFFAQSLLTAAGFFVIPLLRSYFTAEVFFVGAFEVYAVARLFCPFRVDNASGL